MATKGKEGEAPIASYYDMERKRIVVREDDVVVVKQH
jgi:hypothetical protein